MFKATLLASAALVFAGSVASAQEVSLEIDLFGASANTADRGSLITNTGEVDDVTRVDTDPFQYAGFSGDADVSTLQVVGVRQTDMQAQDVLSLTGTGNALVGPTPIISNLAITGENNVIINANDDGRNRIDLVSGIDADGSLVGVDTNFGGLADSQGSVTNRTALVSNNVTNGNQGTLNISVENNGAVEAD